MTTRPWTCRERPDPVRQESWADALFGSPPEARLRVSGAVAWLLEPEYAEARTQLLNVVGEIYTARSNAVHGNRASRRAGQGMVLEAIRLALRVLSAIFYSSQWLFEIPKSADRGLALILGNQAPQRASSDQPSPPAEPAGAS